MRKIKLFTVAFIIGFSGIPSYAAADGVAFGTLENRIPAWKSEQSGEQFRQVRSGDEWFHIYPEGGRPYQHTFDWVGPFSEGLAPVRKDGREFHIRMDGSDAYEARYDAVGPYNMGYAPAVRNDNWFHIDIYGNRAYERNFKWVGRVFGEGLALVEDKTGADLIINMKGEIMME